jgi:type VI protein secretion system component VasK
MNRFWTKKNFRIYLLAQAANPPAMNFVNFYGADFRTVFATEDNKP